MEVVFRTTTKNFIKDKVYKAKRIFEQWPWMIMAWDKFGIGRYIHQKNYGGYKLKEEGEPK